MINAQIIGVQKAGTTSLYHWLGQHPDILAPQIAKDIHVFQDIRKNPDVISELHSYHTAGFDIAINLHAGVNYCMSNKTLQNIKEYETKTKVILCFRDPVDRAISAYKYFYSLGIERRTLIDALSTELEGSVTKSNLHYALYLEHGNYSKILSSVRDVFDQEMIKVVFYEDLVIDGNKVLNEICRFLNVKNFDFHTGVSHNTSKAPRLIWFNRILHSANPFMRGVKSFIRSIMSQGARIKMGSAILKLNATNKSILLEPTSEELQILLSYYKDLREEMKDEFGERLKDKWITLYQ